ncbi:MAG: hypothetical protein R3B09_21390 [Nannocystaceae bacterium]
MATLVEILTKPETRPRVVRACAELVAAEVDRKSGLSGIAIKGAYRLVQAVKPTMITDVVDRLLPEFAAAMEPFYAESVERAESRGQPLAHVFPAHLADSAPAVAEALLKVTDRRAEGASGPVLKTYRKLRGSAAEHVTAAVPGLARTIAPFV